MKISIVAFRLIERLLSYAQDNVRICCEKKPDENLAFIFS